MSTRMLIDARHPEETRVAVVRGTRIEEFDFEAATKKQLKGNIYLAKVTRVEPSLQAAFVEYGGNRHGFLAFSEIHPDYYQIPHEDREALLEEEAAATRLDDADHHADHDEDAGEDVEAAEGEAREASEATEASEDDHEDEAEEAMRRRRTALRRRYKIQEVIKRRQILLVQVVKEERGGKGAALTTYLSLAGRYSVLMPNTTHGGGISRKISSQTDRRRLKSIMAELKLPAGMGCIIRTAGLKRTKTEIKRDFDYLTRLWDEIREQTIKSIAPALIYEDSSLIKRAIRDIYSRDVDEVWVEGEAGYRAAKDYMRLLMPSHAKKVHLYRDRVPLFHRYQVEAQLESMYRPVVQLRSGGYIVINPTEALVSIDINSGRATKEHNIEETAYKTNLEAAEEIARQLRLRDMAGLIVIDFIDMEDKNNVRNVERRLKEALKNDRARIQVGRISNFGLMEMSRQRLRTGVLEASTHVCPHCNGAGFLRTVQSSSLHVLRALEEEAIKARASHLLLQVPSEIAIYILNRKRSELTELEGRYGITIEVEPKADLIVPNYEIERSGPPPAIAPVELAAQPVPAEEPEEEDNILEEEEDVEDEAEETTTAKANGQAREGREAREARAEGDEDRGGRRRRRRRRRRRNGEVGTEPHHAAEGGEEGDALHDEAHPAGNGEETHAEAAGEHGAEGERRRRRRRRRRGDRSERHAAAEGMEAPSISEAETAAPVSEAVMEAVSEAVTEAVGEPIAAAPAEAEAPAEAAPAETAAAEAPVEEAPKPKRRRTTKAKAKTEAVAVEAEAEAEAPAEEAPKPKRRRTTKAKAAEAEAASTVPEEKPAKAPRRTRKTTKAAAAAATAPAAPEAAPAAPAAEDSGAEPSSEPALAPVATAPEPAAASAPAAANEDAGAANETAEPAAEPRPARRGWWQRTFNGS
ncbi:Rne/Rng family ribonuclease [Pedomonas mirosovicensis]|uniref:Rne/Rng family ribonuclease n=1 Tax=Pedomonas mirosovicensis TaxID=2908641 RepID=UPI002167C3AE|nr:ribonuclease E/G [Pedomonas mirosovicensis]MCH8685565.1 ribonuclease E/G [Pedomonas mirosovicensis]